MQGWGWTRLGPRTKDTPRFVALSWPEICNFLRTLGTWGSGDCERMEHDDIYECHPSGATAAGHSRRHTRQTTRAASIVSRQPPRAPSSLNTHRRPSFTWLVSIASPLVSSSRRAAWQRYDTATHHTSVQGHCWLGRYKTMLWTRMMFRRW